MPGLTLPTEIKVGQAVYELMPMPDGVDETGLCWAGRQQIEVDMTLAPGALRNVVIHETLHAILDESGGMALLGHANEDEESEERVVRFWAAWLLMLLRDNPELVTALTATD